MKTKEVYELKKGDKINHKHYGICTVDSIIPDFGTCIIPESKEGLDLLRFHSGMPNGIPLLETSFRLIMGKVS
jgi:hypothetical protein